MQLDMHFFGTYVLARAAGVIPDHAETIAYAAQFVDDSTHQNSSVHPDGGLLYGIATAHHPAQCALNRIIDEDEQRRVWVPFHFLPGGIGETLEELLLCVKNSTIAREMIEHHIENALTLPYGFELLGIAAHVYMDTFSHYGFSGISSEYNEVDGGSIECLDVQKPQMKDYVLGKKDSFIQRYSSEIFSEFLETGSGALGHAGVATLPDRPFLHWQVRFEKDRPSNGAFSDRDNPATYLEGCEKVHEYFSHFAHRYYDESVQHPFDEFRQQADQILRFEGTKEERIEQWRTAIREHAIYPSEPDEDSISYDHETWEGQKGRFNTLDDSAQIINTHIYRFHQAAALHRYYVLKDLLPSHGIAVY